jgi:hypothetical protein
MEEIYDTYKDLKGCNKIVKIILGIIFTSFILFFLGLMLGKY